MEKISLKIGEPLKSLYEVSSDTIDLRTRIEKVGKEIKIFAIDPTRGAGSDQNRLLYKIANQKGIKLKEYPDFDVTYPKESVFTLGISVPDKYYKFVDEFNHSTMDLGAILCLNVTVDLIDFEAFDQINAVWALGCNKSIGSTWTDYQQADHGAKFIVGKERIEVYMPNSTRIGKMIGKGGDNIKKVREFCQRGGYQLNFRTPNR